MEQKVLVPEIGDIKNVEVIEVLVQSGDTVNAEQSLITLESDKATMEVPSPFSGVVDRIFVKIGDQVSEGTEILSMKLSQAPETAPEAPSASAAPETRGVETAVVEKSPPQPVLREELQRPSEAVVAPPLPEAPALRRQTAHASPSVRRFARELGVDLSRVPGSGRKGRILHEDVKKFVKASFQKPSKLLDFDRLSAEAEVDFSRFGETESQSLSRIKKLSAAHLHRCWLSIPHVTQHGDADITELEAFRKSLKPELEAEGIHLTLLPFLMKAAVGALRRFPEFNASLASGGETLILKKYYHIGVAVDTPEGLVVPVVRNVEHKGLAELARELAELSNKARNQKLKPDEMQGGSFSISSLGGIGGSAFTPIINQPEVAILGVSRAEIRPVYRDSDLIGRLLLPLSLSYDHRVIDGAQAARFVVFLTEILGDLRRLLV